MKNTRLTLIMMFAVLAGVTTILFINAASLMGIATYKYIAPNDVRGMAIEHNGLLYTLNFSQQNHLVDIFNRATSVAPNDVTNRKTQLKHPPEITKIIIYRFDAPDIEIHPVAYTTKKGSSTQQPNDFNFVFSIPQWDAKNYFEEATPNELATILSTTYDS
jgi:hypothetical protein